MKLFKRPRLRLTRRQLQAAFAEAQREAAKAMAYAAERDVLAFQAGEKLWDRQCRVEALEKAVAVLAARLGEAHGHLGHLAGDTVAESVLPLVARQPLFGEVDREYVHKLTGDWIRLTERTAPREWSYVVFGSTAVWAIWDDDLRNEFVEATALQPSGGAA